MMIALGHWNKGRKSRRMLSSGVFSVKWPRLILSNSMAGLAELAQDDYEIN